MQCCMKIILILVNLATILVGLVLTVLGGFLAWGQSIITSLMKKSLNIIPEEIIQDFCDKIGMSQKYFNAKDLEKALELVGGQVGTAIFIVGLIIVLISLLGLFGVCCKNKICLYIYSIVMLLFELAIVIVIIVFFAKPSLIRDGVDKLMEKLVRNYQGLGENGLNPSTIMLNTLQLLGKCCSTNSNNTVFPNWKRERIEEQELFKIFLGKMSNVDAKSLKISLEYPITCFDILELKVTNQNAGYSAEKLLMSGNLNVADYFSLLPECGPKFAEMINSQAKIFSIVMFSLLAVLFVITASSFFMACKSSKKTIKINILRSLSSIRE